MLTADDRLAILDLVARVNAAASQRDVAAYSALFAEDGELTGAMGELQGRAALQAGLLPIWEREGLATLHLALNHVIEGDDTEAKLAYTLLIVSVDMPPTIIGTAAIREHLRKDGRQWRIVSHHVATLPR